MLEDNNLAKIWVYEEDGRIFDFLYISYIGEQLMVSPYLLDEDKIKNELLSIKKLWGDCIIESDWIDVEKLQVELYDCSFVSRINDSKLYEMDGNQHYYTNSASLVNFFVDYFERIYFPAIENTEDISFRYIDAEDIFSYIRRDEFSKTSYPSWSEKYGNSSIIGFHYFKPEDFPNTNYLLAIYNDTIIGVIKTGVYGNGRDKRQSICYIDVSENYRQRGIAKMLIKELGKYLNPNLPLMLTDESELGALCKMAEHFKNAGYVVPVYTFREFHERTA
jgi:ribosomal protein S18 acetylase RimI-like enzyme